MTGLDSPILAVLAEDVDDLERVRKAVENRLRQLTRTEVDKDGLVRGHGLPPAAVRRLQVTLDMTIAAEKSAVSNLERVMKTHPLGSWVSAQHGLGLKTIARLLAAVGDPYWNTLYDRPRLVSELWSYCGLGDASRQRRVKGTKCNWNATAKMRLWNCVQPIIKHRKSPYRAVYDAAKAGQQGAVHAGLCARCGPKGKPAQPGSVLSKGHIEARAQRVVMKAILLDLWLEARRLHEAVDELAA